MIESMFHALFIGIDAYLPNLLSNGAEFRSLGGCVNDVRRAEAALAQRLSDLAATGRLRVRALHAPDAGGKPGGDEDAWPTAANIRRALSALADAARPGDQVYIHYSGHGGRVSTLFPELKGGDGVDEALVPMDIGKPDWEGQPHYARAERYIRDVELARYLDQLANKKDAEGKGVTITLVFDCCHSGGATRGTEIAARTATGGKATPKDPSGTLDCPPAPAAPAFDDAERKRMVDAFTRLAASAATRSAAPAKSTWLPPAAGYVLLAGCRDVEAALEASIDGKPRGGVLTDAYLEALATLSGDQSWKTVYDRVLARVHSRFPSQTPQLLGDIEREVFGFRLLPVEHTLTVTAVDAASGIVTVNGGAALALARGTELGIYHPGDTDFSLTHRRVAIAAVEQVGALESKARVAAGAAFGEILEGAPAVIQGLALRRSVELFRRADLPPPLAARQDAALAAVEEAIGAHGKGFLEVCPAGQTPHYQVAVTPAGEYEVCDPQGTPLRYLSPAFRIDHPTAPRDVVAQLRRLVRYHTVLEMSEPASDLGDQIRTELLLAPPGWTDLQPVSNVGGTPLQRTGDAYSVPHETWVWLRVTNTDPSMPVNIALIDLNRLWEVDLIVPDPEDLRGKRYETIKQTSTFAFKMYTGVDEAFDTFKLFMTTGDVDFRLLSTAGATRGGARSPATNALARLMDSLDAPENQTRESAPARSSSAPWTVREIRFRTYKVE